MIQINDKLKIHFPLNLVPRLQQLDILKFVAESINNEKKYILLNAPPGTGKSYLVNMFINWYLNNANPNAKFDILTNSKLLQDQYTNEFDFIKNLKGRSNYPCDFYDTDCEKGMEMCRITKKRCPDCPYLEAKNNWIEGKVSLTNFHLFDTFALYVPDELKRRESNVLIIDEAHKYEEVFCDYISLKLNSKILKYYGFDQREVGIWDDKLARIKNISQFVNFAEIDFLPEISKKKNDFENEISSDITSKKRKAEISQYINYIGLQISKINNFLEEYRRDPLPEEHFSPRENWVLEIDKNLKEKHYSGIELTVQPVWGYPYLKKKVWDHYDHIIMMSGTILNREIFSHINGIEYNLSAYMDVENPFPIKNRPIYYIKTGKMSLTNKKDTFNIQKNFIKKILKKHKNEKGIIHTSNYEISNWIKEQILDDRLIFHETNNRDLMLSKFITDTLNLVMVSPSMTTGLDLADDKSRFQIICKIPYPFLGSNKIKQRLKTYSKWYQYQTACELSQAYGRSIRSIFDYANTYILDSCFSDLLKSCDSLPRSFTNAIKILT